MQWNPSAPTVLGEEFFPAVPNTLPAYRVASPSDAVAQRLDSTVTQTVDQWGVFLGLDTPAGSFLCEQLIAGSEEIAPADVTTTIVRPNDLTVGSGDDGPGMALSPAAVSAGMTPLDVVAQAGLDPTKYLYNTGNSSTLLMNFATAGLFAGRRILGVRFVSVVSTGVWPFGGSFAPGMLFASETVNTTGWPYESGPGPGAPPQAIPVDTGEMSPYTHQPWTVSDIQDFDSSAAYAMSGLGTSVFMDQSRVFQVYMEVDHCAENRLSRDVVFPMVAGTRWHRFTPHRPDGTANLDKTLGVDITTNLRQARYGVQTRPSTNLSDFMFSVPYIGGSNPSPPPGLIQYLRPTLRSDGGIVALGDAAGSRIIGVDIRVGGTGQADAQTYCHLDPVALEQGATLVRQEFDGASASAYAGVIVPVRVVDTGHDFTLNIAVKRTSDNHLMGTAHIDRATALTFPAGGGNWRVVQAQFVISGTGPPVPTSIVLAPGTQYFFDFTQTGGQGNGGESGDFILAALNAKPGGAGPQPTGIAGYRDTTNVATYGGGDVTSADIAAVVYIATPPPAGFTATAGQINLPETVDCGPSGIAFTRLAWTPIAPSAQFAYYEIQRSDPTSGWALLTRITDSTRGSWYDFEGRLQVQSCYQIRAVTTIGIVSDWSPIACATPADTGCGYTFTSNVLNNTAGGLMVGYVDTGPGSFVERKITFPEAAEVKRQAIYGRDNFVSFIPQNRRGDEFTRQLLISALLDPALVPPGDADVLRDLTRAKIPYVCVRDNRGQRWFANVTVTDYTETNPAQLEHVTVTVGERLNAPTVVVV